MIYLIGTGAAIGSLLRFELTNLIKAKFGANWPLATLIINLIGAFCLGWLFGRQLPTQWWLFLGTGIGGGFTTFSTLNAELVGLFNHRRMLAGMTYFGLSYLGGFILLLLGYWLAGH
ncbi:MAG: CrcB family protein [Lactobacillus sp.]|nr:CrcB family protein [Lactobacillus sp.]